MAGKCEYCGKELGNNVIEREGKKFCCEDCMKAYGKEHTSENENVCRFC